MTVKGKPLLLKFPLCFALPSFFRHLSRLREGGSRARLIGLVAASVRPV